MVSLTLCISSICGIVGSVLRVKTAKVVLRWTGLTFQAISSSELVFGWSNLKTAPRAVWCSSSYPSTPVTCIKQLTGSWRQTVCSNSSLVLISDCAQHKLWKLQKCVLDDTEIFPESSSEIMTSGSFLPIPDRPPFMFTSHPFIILFLAPFLYINPLRVPPMSSLCWTLSCSSYVQRSWEELKQK